MQNSRNSVTLINIQHVLHLKATAALRIVGNILHFFPQDFLLHSFLGNFPVKVWTQIDITLATPIFWRQEMTSEHLLIHSTTIPLHNRQKALSCNLPYLPCFEVHNPPHEHFNQNIYLDLNMLLGIGMFMK